MADPAAVLAIMVTANTKPAQAALAKTQGQLAATGATATKTSAVMKKAFLGIGLAAGAAGVALFKVGEEFDDAFDKISTRTGATGKEMRKLKGVFRDVVSDVPASFDDAATAVGDLNTRLGLSGRPLKVMSKQMTELARITETDVAANVETVSRAFVDWEVATKDQSKTLDGFYRLSQKSGIAVADIASEVQRFGSPLRQFGFSLEEAASMFASFERAGVNTQTMLPGLKFALRSFMEAGLEPGKALRDTFDGISEGTIKAQKAFEIFGGRATPDMIEAIQQGRFEFDKFIKAFDGAEGAIREQGRRTMDLSEHWTKFKNNLKLAVEPVARDVFKGLSDLMKEVSATFKKEGLSGVLDLLLQKLSDAVPKIAEFGTKIAGALVKGFMEAPILAKLAIGGWLLTKFGGLGGVGGLGTRIGNKLGMSMGGAAGPVLAAGIISTLEGIRVGKQLADSMTKDIAEPDFWADAVGLGDDAVKTFIRRAEEAGQTINKEVVQGWVKAGDISVEQGGVMIKALKDVDQQAARLATRNAERQGFGFARSLALDGKLLKPEVVKIINQLQALPPKARTIATNAMVNMAKFLESQGKLPEGAAKRLVEAIEDKFGEIPKDAEKAGGDAYNQWDKWLKRTADKGTEHAKKLKDGVAGNVEGLAKRVGIGLGLIVNNTNSALKAFGVDEIKWQNNTEQPQARQAGGLIVGGTGNGDKVPAMLEPGEVVINKKAVAALGGARRANAINSAIPRFAEGGVAGGLNFALGPYDIPPIAYDANHAGGNSHWHITGNTTPWIVAIGKKLQQMGFMVGEHPAFGGVNAQHSATGGHYDALAIDVNSAADETRAETAAVARLIGGSGAGSLPAAIEKLKRVILEGPAGPLRSIGQAALDKTWKAANAFIRKSAPTATATPGGGTSSYHGPLDKVFPSHGLSDAAGHVRLSPAQVTEIASKAGLPGSTFEKIAHGESMYYPGIIGDDAAAGYGNTFGYGLWQITSGPGGQGPPNGDLIQRLGGMRQMFNPVTNSLAAKALYDAGGISPWFGTQYLAGGGVAGKRYTGPWPTGQNVTKPPKSNTGQFTYTPPTTLGPAIGYLSLPNSIAGQIWRMAQVMSTLEEQIANAEILHAFASSQLGVDLGPDEQAFQIALNDQLLASYLETVGWLTQGLTTPNLNPAIRSDLVSTLQDLQGITGQGGKILNVRQKLDQLGAASTAAAPDTSLADSLKLAEAMDFARRYNVSQAQYAVLAGMPVMHDGGVVPGATGASVPIMAQAGEYVSPAGGPNVTVIIEGGPAMAFLKDFVRVEIDGQTRKAARGRPLPGVRG